MASAYQDAYSQSGSAVAGGPAPVPLQVVGDGLDQERFRKLAEWLRQQRQGSMTEAQAFTAGRFGESNPAIRELMKARHDAAFGLDAQTGLERAQGVRAINSQFTTGMRSLRGLQGATGLSGGAAIGQALPTLAKANLARADLESNLAQNAANRRAAALNDYESTLTGERAGELGTQFGLMGLGSADRTGAMQYILGKDYVQALRDQAPGGRSYNDQYRRAQEEAELRVREEAARRREEEAGRNRGPFGVRV